MSPYRDTLLTFLIFILIFQSLISISRIHLFSNLSLCFFLREPKEISIYFLLFPLISSHFKIEILIKLTLYPSISYFLSTTYILKLPKNISFNHFIKLKNSFLDNNFYFFYNKIVRFLTFKK